MRRTGQGTYVGGGHQHGRWQHGTRARASASARQRLLNSCPASLLLTLALSSTSGTIHQTSNGVAFLGYHFHIRAADVYHRDASGYRQGWKRSSTFSSRRRLSHSGDPIDCTAFGIPLISDSHPTQFSQFSPPPPRVPSAFSGCCLPIGSAGVGHREQSKQHTGVIE